jgi:hypothetical protein
MSVPEDGPIAGCYEQGKTAAEYAKREPSCGIE